MSQSNQPQPPEPQNTPAQVMKDYLIITLGTVIMSLGVYFFMFPNNFTTGGVDGLAIILGSILPVSRSTLMLVFNWWLLVVGFLVLGKDFGIRTAYESVLYVDIVWVLEHFFPMSGPFTDEPLLELFFAIGLPAVGVTLLFNVGASSGGMDIVAMLIRKFTSLNISTALMMANILVVIAGGTVFGLKTGLLCIMGITIKALAVDGLIERINNHKYFNIITYQPEMVCDFIVKDLNRSATIVNGTGAFTHDQKAIILSVMSGYQAMRLRQFVHRADHKAFITITNTSEIIGHNFRDRKV